MALKVKREQPPLNMAVKRGETVGLKLTVSSASVALKAKREG